MRITDDVMQDFHENRTMVEAQRVDTIAAILKATGRYGDDAYEVATDVLAAEEVFDSYDWPAL